MSDTEYLVRGALLKCSCGSHLRRLNLPQCHGVYVKGHPVIQENDKEPEKNISYFGVCSKATSEDSEEVLLVYSEIDRQYNPSLSEDIQGYRCTPQIPHNWMSKKKDTYITKDFSAATTESYLFCTMGGIIEPVTSGQEYEGE